MAPAAHHYTGKVRDLYEVDHDRMLIVASDRISVFDVVLPDEIPDKGRVLTGLSTFWFEQTAHLWPNHVVSSDPTDFPETAGPEIAGRAMLVRATRPVRLECIARGYLFGSAWTEYAERGTVCGRTLPAGSAPGRAAARADLHAHHQGRGRPRPDRHRRRGRRARRRRHLRAGPRPQRCASTSSAPRTPATQGVILADTKLEFGAVDGELLVIDEMLTPDSSRYWPAEHYAVGGSPPSFDKQFVRDHYLSLGWDQRPPAPPLPPARDRRAPAPATSRPTSCSPARASTSGSAGVEMRSGLELEHWARDDWAAPVPSTHEVRGAGRGHPPPRRARSAGRDRRAGAPGARLHERHRGAIGKTIRLVVERRREAAARAQVDEMCQRLLANPVIEAYTIDARRSLADAVAMSARVGVVVFPGTNCELDVRARGRAPRRHGRAALARRPHASPASTPSSCPAASRTATTCAPAPSPASRR